MSDNDKHTSLLEQGLYGSKIFYTKGPPGLKKKMIFLATKMIDEWKKQTP